MAAAEFNWAAPRIYIVALALSLFKHLESNRRGLIDPRAG